MLLFPALCPAQSRHALLSATSPAMTNLDSLGHVLPAGCWHQAPPQQICLEQLEVGRCVWNSCSRGLLELWSLGAAGLILCGICWWSMSPPRGLCHLQGVRVTSWWSGSGLCREAADAETGSALHFPHSPRMGWAFPCLPRIFHKEHGASPV